MLTRLRENGPVVLVPLAWAFVTAAHLGAVSERTLLAAHVVMEILLVAFVTLSWTDMREGVLLAWRRVILGGVPITFAGMAGLLATPSIDALLWVAVVGWMGLPAAGLVYTGQRVDTDAWVYTGGGGLSAVGGVVYLLAPALGEVATLGGLALVGLGQTAGIVAAVVRY